jgi:hypothetical protein
LAFEAEKHGKSTRRTTAGTRTQKRGGLLFGGGFALGVATTALGFLLLGPELSAPQVEDSGASADQDAQEGVAQGALAAAQPSAAAPTEPGQPTAADSDRLQPTAAPAQEPPPAAAPAEVVAASAEGTETTPSAATAAPAEPARPQQPAQAPVQVAAPKPPPTAPSMPPPAAPIAPARAAEPVVPALKAEPAAPPPAKVAPPVDPNSQDAKLAAAAQVHLNAGTPIDSMLDQAFSPTARPADKANQPAAPTAVPPAPTRDDVVKAMSVLIPAIRGCAQGQSGMAPVSIVVHSDGRVESAALSSGPFQGSASGRCMEGVVRRARFPRFSQPSFRVQFPFAIQ